MARQTSLCVTLLVILNFSLVLGRNDFYQYFYSHHRSSSTAATPFSTPILDVSSSYDVYSKPEVSSSDDVFSKPDSKGSTDQDGNKIELQHSGYSNYDRDNLQTLLIVRVVVIVGSIVLFIGLLCCLKFCCPHCCSTTRPGMILSSNIPVQRIPTRPELQQPVLQHSPPEQDMTQFPPPYHTQPAQQPYQLPYKQQQLQYSPIHQQDQYSPHQQQFPPTEINHNPPTVPPAYEHPRTKY